jgi:hypothetical protein
MSSLLYVCEEGVFLYHNHSSTGPSLCSAVAFGGGGGRHHIGWGSLGVFDQLLLCWLLVGGTWCLLVVLCPYNFSPIFPTFSHNFFFAHFSSTNNEITLHTIMYILLIIFNILFRGWCSQNIV